MVTSLYDCNKLINMFEYLRCNGYLFFEDALYQRSRFQQIENQCQAERLVMLLSLVMCTCQLLLHRKLLCHRQNLSSPLLRLKFYHREMVGALQIKMKNIKLLAVLVEK